VRGGAEAVEAEPAGVARQAESAVADEAGGEQRRRVQIAEAVGDRKQNRTSSRARERRGDAVPRLADDLEAWDERQLRVRELAVDDV
jgi:hypothetical protein